ncbi:MAG: glycine zipper domain-containing protein [Planctomycetota bacterium]
MSILKHGLLLIFAFVILSPASAFGQSRAQQRAIQGGTAGAIIGGIAGHQNDETIEGIAIGTVFGALMGNAVGRQEDERLARQYQYQAYQQQQWQQQQQLAQQQLAQALTMTDVVTLVRSGISDQLIIQQVQAKGVRDSIGVNEIVSLHQNGVSEPVIQAMQNYRVNAQSSGQTNQRYPYPAAPRFSNSDVGSTGQSYQQASGYQYRTAAQPTVVIERQPSVIVVPQPTYVEPFHYYHRYHRPHPGVGFQYHYRR